MLFRSGQSLSVWITASNNECMTDFILADVAETGERGREKERERVSVYSLLVSVMYCMLVSGICNVLYVGI